MREYVTLRAMDKEVEISFLQTLLLAKATLLSVSSSTKDVKDYNSLLKQYKNSVLGITTTKEVSSDQIDADLLNKMKGDNIPNKPQVSTEFRASKFDGNIENVSVSDFRDLAKE